MSDSKISNSQEEDEKLGVAHQDLQGWVPRMASEEEIRSAFEKAFDYRGDLTSYIFDRRADSPRLKECVVRLMPKVGGRLTIPYSDIAALAFTGKDTAAGKSFEAWVKKYKEKKAAGEKNIGIEAEPLD
ncbi:MAG: hypothetical protein DMG70_13595 [Acidobacteria bacterium]|nr:MAG: hypothetical protein DMG70_13595 [Acidobacteriota bacterium]